MKQDARERIEVNDHSFSKGELDWAGKNLDYLQDYVRSNRVQSITLVTTFVIGLVLYGIVGSPIIADFIYTLGYVMWTSVVLTYLLNVLVARKQRSIKHYIHEVREALRQQGQPVPSTDASHDAGDNGGAIDQQLMMVMLNELKELKAEVAALRVTLNSTNTCTTCSRSI